ncbi:glycoside hydrolase family 113 [Novacetimonas pomaceti]|uniref:glycoside hydrolase family 113 n=1 Tax=Novacetimonas pomaceti TaxID=2021998 RepID=UPI001EF04765|nr:glycosidase-like protein [Novacetimonas pomaceti]
MKIFRIVLIASVLALSVLFFFRTPSYWTGVNIKMSANAPWGSPAAQASMKQLAQTGARMGMLVAFAWQDKPESVTPVLGNDSQPDTIRQGLRDIRAAGLTPMLKIHLWIPWHWAGEVAPAQMDEWFANYQKAIMPLIDIAREENVPAVFAGTELRGVETASQWPALVSAIRAHYAGQVIYDTDSLEQAEKFQHWDLFDAVATSLYTALPDTQKDRIGVMTDNARRLQNLGEKWKRPVWVAELGLRSGQGILQRPWMSPEQVKVPVDLAIQKTVLTEWRDTLTTHGVTGISIWCWYTDPHDGGTDSSDFTVQNKPASSVLSRPAFRF